MISFGLDRPAPTLTAFLENFCTTHPSRVPQAGDVDRPTQIQPGVYWTLEAPFIGILALIVIASAGRASSLPKVASIPR
jgi:hypothetical protein